jgi:hypothetical protein
MPTIFSVIILAPRLNPGGYDDQFHKQQELIDSLRKKIQEMEQAERVKPQGVRPL